MLKDALDETGESLLTAGQVARLLNIKVATVYAAAADGRLPHVKLWKGNRRSLIRFREHEITNLIRERSVPTARSRRV